MKLKYMRSKSRRWKSRSEKLRGKEQECDDVVEQKSLLVIALAGSPFFLRKNPARGTTPSRIMGAVILPEIDYTGQVHR